MNVRSTRLLILLSGLLIGAGLFVRFRYSASFDEQLLVAIQRNIDRELAIIETEADQLLRDNLSSSSPAWEKSEHFYFHVDSGRIVSWNRTSVLPDPGILSGIDSITFIESPRGAMLAKRWAVADGSSLFCLLTLTDHYPIINNFLSAQWNPAIFPIKDVPILPHYSTAGLPVLVHGKVLFRILPLKSEPHESVLSFVLLLAGLATLLAGLLRVTKEVQRAFGYDLAFITLFAGLLGLRLGMIGLSFPSLFFPSDVFDPKKFASSSLNASMGDLLFNSLALLIVVIYLFLHFDKFRFVNWILRLEGFFRLLAGTLSLLACFFALLFPYDFIEAIYHNSTLSLDITQSISFDMVRIIALASVLTGCISSFLFIHVFFSLASHLFGKQIVLFFAGLSLAGALFALQYYLFDRNLAATLLLGVLLLSILRISKLHAGGFKVSFQLFIYLIFSLIIFSFQYGWAVRVFFQERQVQDQVRFGKDFLTERDVLGEYLLDQARHHIEGDQFIQMRMASPFLSKSAVVDKIRRVYLSNYFDRYEISVRTLSEEQDGIDSVSQDGFSSGSFVPTGYTGILYAQASDGNTVKRYRVTIPVFYQRPVGVVLLELSLKRVIPNNVYPELLVDNRFNQIYRSRDFSYAVFSKGKLISGAGPFNYERDFQHGQIENPDLYDAGITEVDYHHIGIEDPDGSIAVVSASIYSWFNFVTNFSFWFVVGLVLLFIGQGTLGIYAYFKGQKFNYTSRIQLFIFFAFLLPVLAVSMTTLTLIGRSNEESIKKDFLERSLTISQRIAGLMSIDSARTGGIEGWIEENAASSKIDISVYSPKGTMMATSQPALFDDQLISRLMDREAWKKIVLQREVQAVTNERIGKLQYSCAYSAVQSPDTGELQAIVGLPFFESATFLQRSQSLILSNILIVFVVVFILFSLLSYWASSSLTFPIRFITKTLGQTTFTGENKPLQWNSTDEIGTLVREYNRMVENLEESKRALARSEKESAWREMAKQVAHEIKNPLTPMKLTLQQMEQALKSGVLSDEKSQKSIEVLLKQVNILNEIAASFSTFARMPALSPQTIDLNGFLQSAVNLFDASEGKVEFSRIEGSPSVSVDPTSLNRAVSNIIINALQAGHEGRGPVEVNIEGTVEAGVAVIKIRDNGRGMSHDVQEKIFQPQFTTKKSGSGLGLAMTRQIIGQAGGKIWFKSAVDQGTTFFIELPVA